jgi:hypothetical protein
MPQAFCQNMIYLTDFPYTFMHDDVEKCDKAQVTKQQIITKGMLR